MARLVLGFFALCSLCIYVNALGNAGCAPNEVPMPCGKSCEPTCTQRELPPCVINIRVCRDQCRCDDGLYRDLKTGSCVTREQCSTMAC